MAASVALVSKVMAAASSGGWRESLKQYLPSISICESGWQMCTSTGLCLALDELEPGYPLFIYDMHPTGVHVIDRADNSNTALLDGR